MIAQHAWSFLEKFDDENVDGEPIGAVTTAGMTAGTIPGAVSPEGPVVSSAQVEEAYAKGLQAGVAEGWAMRQEEISQMHSESELRVEQAKVAFAGSLIEMSETLHREIDQIGSRLADEVLQVLTPVLKGVVTDRAIKELVEEMHHVATARDGLVMEIAGPPDLVACLRQSYCARKVETGPAAELRIVPGEGAEVRVSYDQTVMETRIARWLSQLEEAIA